jgi:hypothetical protein
MKHSVICKLWDEKSRTNLTHHSFLPALEVVKVATLESYSELALGPKMRIKSTHYEDHNVTSRKIMYDDNFEYDRRQF